MPTNEIAQIMQALASLVSAVAWPALVIFLLYLIAPELKRFAGNLSEVSIKLSGFEALVKKSQTEVAAALSAAAASNPDEASENKSSARDAVKLATETITEKLLTKSRVGRVLWVDDQPNNNRYERQALEAIGLIIETSTSTEDAIEKLKYQNYNLVISDLGRPPDARAGLTLLVRMRDLGYNIPYIIYASSRVLPLREEAKRLGAFDCTNRSTELFKFVSEALNAQS
jgi:CheY-like chemotaxis protein